MPELKPIYTAGYTGRKPERLKQIAEERNLLVVDIRYSWKSRVPYWNAYSLKALIGCNYTWVSALGNMNYKSGDGIRISDIDRGIDIVESAIDNMPWKGVILLCACKPAKSCHRTVVGEAFRKLGYEVSELDWKDADKEIEDGTD